MELKPALILDVSDPASKAISEISKTGLVAVIMKDNKYFGLIDDREIRRHGADISKTKCENLSMRSPHIEKDYTLEQICNSFFSGRWKALPVFERGKVAGLLTRADVIKMLMEEGLIKNYRAADVMSSPVASIDPNATLANAKAEMKKHNVRRLAVIKGGYLEGILSSFDLSASDLYLAGSKKPPMSEKSNPDLQPVSSYMRKEVHTLPISASLHEAAKMMVENEISAVIIGDSTKAIGIITARDIFETAMKAGKESNERVFLSGLSGEDKAQSQEIMEACRQFIAKLQKTHPITSLSLHIKSYGSKYSARARLDVKGLLIASSNEWGLQPAVESVLRELRVQLDKRKANKMHLEKR
ncbi:hypothetical protein AUJ17_03790 [Candidatus Micrarchaeota archaeon CG1_02_47_40]|nr:MAG: hypothetical protein AUJ17_03790 [Candidatus Micrarchaeota archaeon CG1_02_47_40]